MYYDETACADSWYKNANISDVEKIKAVEDYFDDKGIKIFKIKIKDDGIFDPCDACFCRTGNIIKCKVYKNDIDMMILEGFYQ